jgi:hypothetical protein
MESTILIPYTYKPEIKNVSGCKFVDLEYPPIDLAKFDEGKYQIMTKKEYDTCRKKMNVYKI